jgi:membrane-bound serine protease (ClpP class)
VCEQIKKERPDLVIVEIDTPGGEVLSTLRISSALRDLTKQKIKTVAFITRTKAYGAEIAWSAGAFIALSCQEIYMSRGTSMGASEPVALSPEGAKPLGEKYVSALRGQIAAIAEENNHPKYLAIAMVDKETEIWEVKIEDKIYYLDTYQKERVIKEGKVKEKDLLKEPYKKKGKLLTLSAKEAVKVRMAEAVVSTRDELFNKLGIKNPRQIRFKRTWSEEFVSFLVNPIVSTVLLIVGIIGIWTEIKTPGFGAPGIVGILCLALLFFGNHLAGLAQITEILIFVAGVSLIILEIFILPLYGVFAILGVICVIASLILSFNEFTIPANPIEVEALLKTLQMVFFSFLFAVVGFLLLITFLPHIPILNKLVHKAQIVVQRDSSFAIAQQPQIMGQSGIAVTDLRPAGKVEVAGEVYDVITDGEYISKGHEIVVIKIEGNKIFVSRK